jgi:hypothetical protein
MWSRAALKEQAKQVLRKYYWIALLVTLMAGILGGGGTPTFNFRFNDNHYYEQNTVRWQGDSFFNSQDFLNMLPALLTGLFVGGTIAIVALAVGVAFRMFVGGPVEVGKNRYFLDARLDRSEFGNVFCMFRSGRYLNVAKATGWRMLFTFLWSLLLIIPGIIMGYAYSMMPYLLADNPTLDYRRAMELSKAMTAGQKWDIFVLDLSFLGWYLLGMLLCCVGVVFVAPYAQATKAELYVTLRQNALNAGMLKPEDVNL